MKISLFFIAAGLVHSSPLPDAIHRPVGCSRTALAFTKLAEAFKYLWQAEISAGLAALENRPLSLDIVKKFRSELATSYDLGVQVEYLSREETDEAQRKYFLIMLEKLNQFMVTLRNATTPEIPKFIPTRKVNADTFSVWDLPTRNSFAVLQLKDIENGVQATLDGFLKSNCS